MVKLTISYIICFIPSLIYTQNWVQVGLGVYNPSQPKVLYTDTVNNLLYATGNFKTISNDTIWGIASWNGVRWDSLGSGVKQGLIEDITTYNGYLYIVGGFTNVGNLSTNYIARWNGIKWDSLPPNDIGNWAFALYEYNSELYVSGMFGNVGASTSKAIAKWNGSFWSSVGSPSWNLVIAQAMKEYGGELYVGGAFDANSNNLLKFDGTNWLPVGSGVTSLISSDRPVKTIEVFQNKLFIAGDIFTPYPNNVIYWDGVNYFPVGGGTDGTIHDITIFNGELYVVGSFFTAGGISAQNIAKWDGTKWCGFGSLFNGAIKSVEVFNNELYIGGAFTSIDGLPINGIAKWIGGNFVGTCGTVVEVNNIESLSNEVTIYPNPTTGIFTLETNSSENTTIEIYNNLGQLIIKNNLIQNLTTIDLTKFSKGMYFVRISTINKVMVEKIVYH